LWKWLLTLVRLYAASWITGNTSTVRARNGTKQSSNRNIVNDTIQNNSASAITVNQLTITWNKTPKTLTAVVINGVTWWSGSVPRPPAVLTISPARTIPAHTTYAITRVSFNSSAAGDAGITMSCRFTDSSSSSPCTIYPAQASTCTQSSGSLTITSMGKTTGSNLYKTIQATYNTSSGNISAYQETSNSVP